jgi:pimeloyl-ACP methyl ester carboxylesterase
MPAEPFRIEIPQARLDDLRRRLQQVHWAHDYANDDWSYGANGDYLRELVEYWLARYDWRAQEKALNSLRHFRTSIDGVPIHFIHERGQGPAPIPLVLTHGWPWTFWDFSRVIGPLADPGAHGGDPADAFDVVVPSLPGFAFSTPLAQTGIHWGSTADLWVKLMRDVLGYARFGAHGGDWGALVTSQLGHKYADALLAVHLTNAFPLPVFHGERPWALGDVARELLARTPEERAEAARWERKFVSHVAVHMIDPQTLAFALHDSPLGLLAWIAERRRAWGDCRGDLERRFSKDHLLTTIMLYWLTDSFVTSVRYYAEAARFAWKPAHTRTPAIGVPTGLTLFRHDLPPGSLDWTSGYYDLRFLRVRESGGHFAAYEEPEAVVADLRELFRPLRP